MSTAGLTHLPVSGTLRSPTIDYSSLSTLADCQWKWHNKYVLGNQYEPSTAMKLGSLLGECSQEFYAGRPWEPPIIEALKEWTDENPEAEFSPEWIEKATWIMERYAAHYADDRKEVVQIGAEVPFRLRLPGRYGWLVGRIDEVWKIDRRTWIVERKSGADFRKIDSGLFQWDPQTSLYYWAARELGLEPWGICVDFLRTYRWKRDEHKHPPEDSFKREWYDRNSEHLAGAIAEAGKGLTLAKLIIGGAIQPLRNLGEHCSWCECRNACMTDLAFGDLVPPDEFEWEMS
jgi:PD-(D/E)XK nuclease superfamily protein